MTCDWFMVTLEVLFGVTFFLFWVSWFREHNNRKRIQSQIEYETFLHRIGR